MSAPKKTTGYLCFKKNAVSETDRHIRMDGQCDPPNKSENIVHNQKYSLVSFVPLVLFDQFRYFFNFFFLLITLSQFIPALKVGFTITYVAPLVFVLGLTMIKEAIDDLKRYQRDKEANSQLFQRVLKGDTDNFVPTKSADLKVGDIIELKANMRIPADCVLLWTNDPSDTVFVRTDQLDGETDWKLRKPVSITHKLKKNNPNSSIYFVDAEITAAVPNEQIYDFNGLFVLEPRTKKQAEPLSLENTLWCSTVLATSHVLAMVVYTGLETRIAMNSRETETKAGALDKELNQFSKILFILMMFSAFSQAIFMSSGEDLIVIAFRYFLLISSIIPISLRVNLDFSKLIFSYRINVDPDIPGAIARNSSIPEELGRVQYILSDKTGTLTQNEMIFKQLSSPSFNYDETKIGVMKEICAKEFSTVSGPMADVEEKLKALAGNPAINNTSKRLFRRNKNCVLRDLISAVSLCHNVTPIDDEETKERVYQASSPDEIALVKFGESVGVLLEKRDQREIVLVSGEKTEKYKILQNFPFSSETKRMGIILLHEESERIIFYLKGADSIMNPRIQEYSRAWIMEECENLALSGLRTLVIAQKLIKKEDYDSWLKDYNEAQASMEKRAEKTREVVDRLEKDMELLGVTGVEDKLQVDIGITIELCRKAGIAVWMLTGDKVETACCIAISAGFKRTTENFFKIIDCKDPHDLQNTLNDFDNLLVSGEPVVLVIDGSSLGLALEHMSHLFFQTATKAGTVICCRCSPTQKALVTEGIKLTTGKKTLGIGDGGNDVGMIQKADVGVGIVGKEGKQAALASDFSILQFKDLVVLLLWHGRNAYKRTAVMANFVIHRGMVISVIQYIFQLIYYGVSIPIYNGWLMLGYSTLYTCFPVFALIFNEDVSKSAAMQFPELYQDLQKGRRLNIKMFFVWVSHSIYQGATIMICTTVFWDDSFIQIVSITFSALLFSEMLNILTEVSNISITMIIAQVFTFACYIFSIYAFEEMIQISRFDQEFLFKIFEIVMISWFPIFFVKMIMRWIHPTDARRIAKQMKMKQEKEEDYVPPKSWKKKLCPWIKQYEAFDPLAIPLKKEVEMKEVNDEDRESFQKVDML